MTNLRRKAGVGAGGGQEDNGSMEGHSLEIDQPFGCRTSPVGEARRETNRRRVAAAEAARSSGGGPQDRPPPEKPGIL
jgi:hypothetical protein